MRKRTKNKDRKTGFHDFPDFEEIAHGAEGIIDGIEKEIAAEPSEERRKALLSLQIRQKMYAQAMRGDANAIMLCMLNFKMISKEKYNDYLKIKAECKESEKQDKEDSLYG